MHLLVLDPSHNKKSLVDHINYLGYSMILENDDINLALSLKTCRQFSPDDPYLLDSIAWGYYKMGDYVHDPLLHETTLMPGAEAHHAGGFGMNGQYKSQLALGIRHCRLG